MTYMSQDAEKSPAEQLATPVQFLKGVGPDRALLLEKLGLRNARDILFFFPRDYQDMSELRSVAELEEGSAVSVCGTVEEVELRSSGMRRSKLHVVLRSEGHELLCIWFNQPFMQARFRAGQRLLVSGEPKLRRLRWEVVHPKIQWLDDDETPPAGCILPIYSLTDGLKQYKIRRVVQEVVGNYGGLIEEVFPKDFLQEHDLLPIHEAVVQIHTPDDSVGLQRARRRFIYQELLVLQLAVALRKWNLTHQCQSPELPATTKVDARIRRRFPFELTTGQRQAIREISTDMARSFPMNRLLQGEVGSGKTVVAEYAMLVAVAHGHQAAIMAPTEVLARQHMRTLARDLAQSRVRLALLTGGISAAQRKETLHAIEAGDVDIVVGTHAIIQGQVQFPKLGLVVIDEQHKFGVRQRASLRQAGLDPHYLVMTATPIPRTIAMTLFGDLDVSSLHETPAGRQTVHTYLGDNDRRDKWWEFFCKKLAEGRQGYVVTPLVEEASDESVASVEQCFHELSEGPLQGFRLGLIHGRMKPEAKEKAMDQFRSGATQVLVATSVIEVGIDVANATLMTIESSERFGLAQLHQLRGRICRGAHAGFLCAFGNPKTDDSQRRLEAFAGSVDGFELAEIDFGLRGPGDLFSTRQHGVPPLRIADLRRDGTLLEEARKDAQLLIAEDPEIRNPNFERLRTMVLRRYGAALDLGDVG